MESMIDAVIKREVKDNPENIQKIYEQVEEILEADFDGIYDFFVQIIRESYDYVILMSRRCLVLYQLFAKIFYLEDEDILLSSGCVISDKAVPFYVDQMKEAQKVAIVDDIIIHGRGVCQLYETLSVLCPALDIMIHGYTAENVMDCVPDEIREKVVISYYASTGEWRRLSNKIVDSILVSGIPYTSFVTSYYQYNDNILLSKLKNDGITIIEDYTDIIQHNRGIKYYCLFEENWDRPELFKQLSLGECIRVYWNESINCLTIIPYVLLRTMTIDELDRVMHDVGMLLPAEFKSIKNFFAKTKTAEQDAVSRKSIIEYKMRILTCMLSNYYWEIFKNRYSLFKQVYIDTDTLSKSFGNEIAGELCGINVSNMENSVKYCPIIEWKNQFGTDELKTVLLESYKKYNDISEVMKQYFLKAWDIDEKEAKKKNGKKQGLSIESFIYLGELNNQDKKEILAILINKWDIGVATANFVYDGNNQIVGCFVTPGEQSYKNILEENTEVMRALLILSNMLTKGDAKKANMAFEKYRMSILEQLLEVFAEHITINNQEEISALIKETSGYLNAWDQPALYHSPFKQKELLKEFINKNL